MKAEDIFQKSVSVMKGLLTRETVLDSLQRARERSEEENFALLKRQREEINEIVRRVVGERDSSGRLLEGISQELKDAIVMRYLRNRDIFMKTFPQGLEDVDTDPLCLWAAIMISPLDEPGAEPQGQ